MTTNLDYRATRNVGDVVRVDGPYFGSLAVVTKFYPQAEPTMIDFEVIESTHEPYVRVGETGQAIAGYCEVVRPA